MAMVMDSNGYWTWENPARRKDARALSKGLRNLRAPGAAIGQRLLGPLSAAIPSDLGNPEELDWWRGGEETPLFNFNQPSWGQPPLQSSLGDVYQAAATTAPGGGSTFDPTFGLISSADASGARGGFVGSGRLTSPTGNPNLYANPPVQGGKPASAPLRTGNWRDDADFATDMTAGGLVGLAALANVQGFPKDVAYPVDWLAGEDVRPGWEKIADTVQGWFPGATASTGGGLTAPQIADDRIARGLGGAAGFGEGLALAHDAWSKGLTSAWDDGLYGADEVVLDMDIPENVMLEAGTRAQQGQPGVPLHMQKAMDTTLASDMLSGYDLGQYESKAGKLFSDRPATKDEPFDSYVRTTSGMGLLPGVEVQDTWSFQPSVFKSHDINPIANLAEHVTQPIRATSSWVDKWSPISMVTTPEIEQQLAGERAIQRAFGAVEASGLTGPHRDKAIEAAVEQAKFDPWGNVEKFAEYYIGEQQKAQEAERVAQAAQAAAQAEAARAAQRASVTQPQAEQAVITRNQPDRGLQQAEAQRVADIVTRASTVPIDRGLKKAEENRKAQQAAQAAALNQQAALAAAAHQAQAAKAQAELAAFKNSRAYQDFNASIPAHLIDMATQVDTFSDIAYGGHQGRHGEGWGGESTASRGGRGGAF